MSMKNHATVMTFGRAYNAAKQQIWNSMTVAWPNMHF